MGGLSVIQSVMRCGNSVTVSVIGGFSGLQLLTLNFRQIHLPWQTQFWRVPPCAIKTCAVCPRFCTGGRGAAGSQSKQISKGP